MNTDPTLVAAIQELIKDGDEYGWGDVLRTYKVACRLSRPMCGHNDPRLPQVLKRAAHWHTRALMIERGIRESLSPDKPTNRISDQWNT